MHFREQPYGILTWKIPKHCFELKQEFDHAASLDLVQGSEMLLRQRIEFNRIPSQNCRRNGDDARPARELPGVCIHGYFPRLPIDTPYLRQEMKCHAVLFAFLP